MSTVGRPIIAFVFILFLVCQSFTIVSADSYQWENLSAAGKGCFPPACAEGQYPMAVLPLVAFSGNLFSFGSERVWTSSNAVDWSSQPKTNWGERYGMQFAFFANKVWMLGGMKSWDDFRNDVWSSDDGKTWKQLVAKAAWQARRGHGLVVSRKKLWVVGGALSSGRSDQTPTRFLNDVWSSEDGIHWRQEIGEAPWGPRDNHTTLVYDDKIWVMGGGMRGKYTDVWSSVDGIDWSLVTDRAPWGERHGSGGTVFDGKMWVYGGVELNDVWSSGDGRSWKQEFAHAPWSTRSAYYSVAFKDRLWIFSGKTGRQDTQTGDIWAMSRSRN